MKAYLQRIGDIFHEAGLGSPDLNQLLMLLVAAHYTRPEWSTTQQALIEGTQKASIGAGVIPTFMRNGKRYVVLAEAGEHYFKDHPEAATTPAYMALGGYINLTETEGSSFVSSNGVKPEDADVGAAREGEEEMRNKLNQPVLHIHPSRLRLVDSRTVQSHGNLCVAMSHALDLTFPEADAVMSHADALEKDSTLRHHVASFTKSKFSGLPEIASIRVFALEDVAEGKCNLLHSDQIRLFHKLKAFYETPPGLPRLPHELPPEIIGMMEL